MLKIALVNPPITPEERYGNFGKVGGFCPPLGLAYIAAVLEKEGHNVKIIDGQVSCSFPDDILKLLDVDTDIVGITATTVSIHRAMKVAKKIKEWKSDVKIVIGGPHVSAIPEKTLQTGLFDFGVIGEGETTIIELLRKIEGDGSVDDIDSIAYLKNKKVVMTKRRELIKNLDSIPFPARHLLPDLRVYRPNAENYRRLPTTTMITSRGCPYGCTFCDKSVFGRTFRAHSPEYVVNEMEELSDRYKMKELFLVDDTFTFNNARVFEICRLIKERKLDISWNCFARVDTVTKELLKEMAGAGCWMVSYGVESGNQEVLNLINKGVTLDRIKNAIRWTKNAGLETKGTFMIGHPADTIKTIDETINFAISLPLDQAAFTITTPFPNTQLFDIAKKTGKLITTDWSEYSMWNPVYIPENLTEELILRKHKEAYRKFYLRPQYIFRQLLNVRSAGDLKRKIIGAKTILSL